LNKKRKIAFLNNPEEEVKDIFNSSKMIENVDKANSKVSLKTAQYYSDKRTAESQIEYSNLRMEFSI